MRSAKLLALGALVGACGVATVGVVMGQGAASSPARIVGVTGFDEGSVHVAVAWELQGGQLAEVARGTVPKARLSIPNANHAARTLVRANIARFAATPEDQRLLADILKQTELAQTQPDQNAAYQKAIDMFYGRVNCPECDAEYTRCLGDDGSPTQCFAAYVKCILSNCH